MLLHAVTPITVGPSELARRQARYDALAPAGIQVVLSDLHPGGPRALDTAAELRRRITGYGWDTSFQEVTVLDLGVADITDPARWAVAMRPVLSAARAAGVTAVVNGCSAVDTADQESSLPLVLDPIRTGLGVLGRSAVHRPVDDGHRDRCLGSRPPGHQIAGRTWNRGR